MEYVKGGTILNGTACDDLNALTFGDVYTNSTCAGFINGTVCNDGNTLTSEEKYLNGICQGGLFTAGNNLKYDQCEGGLKNLSTATSYCSLKGMRLPTIAETSDTWFGAGINGVPACSSWTKTATINTDIYGYGYYIWLGQTYNYGIVTDNSNVRCVK